MPSRTKTIKSLEMVKADLLKKLVDNARDVLKKDFNITDDTTNVETLLRTLAVNRFKMKYKYEYDDDGSKINPPGNLGDSRPKAALCSIVPPLDDQVNKYLETVVFSGMNLPGWMREVAVSDLSDIANKIAAKDTEGKWEFSEFKRTYDGGVEDKDSFQCDSILIYCNGSLVEDGSRAALAVIYYVGVYYRAFSETKAVRDLIHKSAYSTAQQLGGGNLPGSHQQLESSLDAFAKTKFQSHFGFDFNADPPQSLRAKKVTAASVTRNSKLYYIPDGHFEEKKVGDLVRNQLYSGINLPLKSIREAAIGTTIKQYTSIKNNQATKSWETVNLDTEYLSNDPANNAVRQVGLILSWFDHQTTDKNAKISVNYIYIMTMFYECQNAEQELTFELYKQVGSNLRRHIENNENLADLADSIELKNYMFEFAKQEFKKTFNFDWNSDYEKCHPPNTKPGGRSFPFRGTLGVTTYPAKEEDVKRWMDAEMFKRDSDTTSPFSAITHAYDDIVEHVLYYGSDSVSKSNNWWYTSTVASKYHDPNGTGKDMQSFAVYLYALGDMSLNKIGKDGTEGVHVKKFFSHYLGALSNYDAAKGDWS